MHALDLFELAILPKLLYNSDTWLGISKDSENKLEDIQLFFPRLALRVPQGTPKVALRSETVMLSMNLRVWKSKLLLVHHIRSLDDRALAKQVYKQQLIGD